MQRRGRGLWTPLARRRAGEPSDGEDAPGECVARAHLATSHSVAVRWLRRGTGRRRRRFVERTAQLPIKSRILYRIEHYSSLLTVALVIIGSAICLVVIVAGLGFSRDWVSAFEVSVSAVTLITFFAIQHTQAREQAATQRKLGELLRAMPGADESLMMLEETSCEEMLDVRYGQRDVRVMSPDTREGPAAAIP